MPFDSFSISACTGSRAHFVSIPRTHCQQITGIVGAVSWCRDIRNGAFHYQLFLAEAVGAENDSFAKPVGFALCPVERSHRLGQLLSATDPPAQFLSSVRINNSDLILVTVVVRHLFSLLRQTGFVAGRDPAYSRSAPDYSVHEPHQVHWLVLPVLFVASNAPAAPVGLLD
jgi:hypothetical protein